MIINFLSARDPSLPYHVPADLPSGPLHPAGSPRPNLLPRADLAPTADLAPRDNTSILPGLVAVIVISVVIIIMNLIWVAICIYKRRGAKSRAQVIYQRPSTSQSGYWQSWFKPSSPGDTDRQSLIRNASTPSITISRPISNPDMGPTPIFNTRDSRHASSIMELPAYEASAPEAAYDPYARSRRSRSRSPPGYHSRASSVSSERSRSISPSARGSDRSRSLSPSARGYAHSRAASNSFSYASSRRPSQELHFNTYYNSTVPETAEEHEFAHPQEKSQPYYKERWSSAQINNEGGSGAGEEEIDIAIGQPIIIPDGPLTPFGEREAKAEAGKGLRSQWYKSPPPEEGEWKV